MDAQQVLQATTQNNPSMPPDDAGKPSLPEQQTYDGPSLRLEYDSDDDIEEESPAPRPQASPLDSEYGYFDPRPRVDPMAEAKAVARREARRVDAAPARPSVDIPRGPGPLPQAKTEDVVAEAPRPALRSQT